MNQNDVKTLQDVLLKIMDVIHIICEKNNIRYYIIGGTALGSVRHKGFIPWDIDIDIAMPRNDYRMFKEVCESELPPSLSYVDYTVEKNFHAPHALVVLNGSKLRRAKDKKWLEGVFVDIFPLDNVPSDIESQRSQANRIKALKKKKAIVLAARQWRTEGRPWNKFRKLVILPWAKFVSVDKINKKMDDIMQEFNNYDCFNCCSMASGYSYEKQNMPIEIYGKPTLCDFENRQYFAPQMVDQYLTKLYKDYMKLPSKEEQEFILGYFDKLIITNE